MPVTLRTSRVAPAAPERLARDRYEALVVGSGFGGAVAACRLAQAGVDVAVVERGRRWRRDEFPRRLVRDRGWWWGTGLGLYDARRLGGILAVTAAGWGGGSLVYANVAMRPPDPVFDHQWPAGWSRAELDPYYDLASHMLGIGPVPVDPATGELPPKARALEAAAERLGHTDCTFRPNLAVSFGEPGTTVNRFGVEQPVCTFCGECVVGCSVGAKNTLDTSYLALAERHGADVGTLTEAVLVAPGPDGRGYRVRLREHALDGTATERDVVADRVFLAAGALGSTELLLRSRDEHRTLPRLPAALGHGYSGNGDFLAFGLGSDDDLAPSSGPTITSASVVRARGLDRDQWFVLEDGGYPAALAGLVEALHPSRLPASVASRLGGARAPGVSESDRTAVLLVMGRDRADGRIDLDRGRLRVRWDTTRNDPLYAAEQGAARDVVRELGGRLAGTPVWDLLRQPVTVHNLGGCRMSDDPATGVTDARGQVHGHPGLYVVDGAALPGATGANPSLTIAALAERCVEAAVRELTGDAGWVAPERAVARRPVLPEDEVIARVLARDDVRPAAGPGLRFRERLVGSVPVAASGAGPGLGARALLDLGVEVPDVALFLADEGHVARLTGVVRVAGLTRGAVPVEGGTMHLLARRGPEGRRVMDYTVPFTADDGSARVLVGRKDVWLHPGNGPWTATTRLRAGVGARVAPGGEAGRPGELFGGVARDGAVAMTPWAVARMLGTLRPTGGVGRVERSRATARFLRFFVTRVVGSFVVRDGSRRG